MAATVNREIEIKPTPVAAAAADSNARRPSSAGISISLCHAAGLGLFQQGTRHALLLSTADTSANSLFHAGCAVVTEPGDDGDKEVLYTTSSLLQTVDSAQLPVVLITRILVQRSIQGDEITAVTWAKLRPPPNMPMPAAMVPYRFQAKEGVLYCAQGNLSAKTSGLFFMPHGRRPLPLVDSLYGTELNSVRDVAVHPRDGALWFTDPHTGFDCDIRNEPQLPNHVYRTDVATAETRAMDDSLQRPTSLCFSPDGSTLYVSDPSSNTTHTRPGVRRAAVYAYDVVDRSGGAFLVNRRVFAYTLQGTPQCVRSDGQGNVFVASGSRIEVRSAGGSLLATVDVPGPSSVSSFCFTTAECDEMYVCAGQELWWVKR